MTLLKPYLALRRLVVVSGGQVVYDQAFSDGLNIIRGSNSSGKSTIADFIFFGLGGDYNAWKLEAERCDYVVCEVFVNDALITLKRQVTQNLRQPMNIYWGPYEAARLSAVEGWQTYSFQRGAQKESFSQALFRALGFPEVKGDVDSNITMHQVLRLLYVDQLSPVDALMRSEAFDSPLTRKTVGELLLGVYDDRLYSEELELRTKQNALEEASRQLDSLVQVLGDTGQDLDLTNVEASIEEAGNQLEKVSATLANADRLEFSGENKVSHANIEQARSIALKSRNEWMQARSELDRQELEVEDSRQFIATLEKRIAALDESVAVRNAFGELPLTHCPQCLSVLTAQDEANSCVLCKHPLPESPERSQASRMRQELAIQVRESRDLLEDKEKRRAELLSSLPQLRFSAGEAERRFRDLVGELKTDRDQVIDSLLVKKGSLESRLEFLHKQARAVAGLESLKQRKNRLASDIQTLQISIQGKRLRQSARLAEAKERIEAYTLALLKQDLPREEWFGVAQSVSVDFAKNTFAVDGRNQFSASSMTYLKNSVHFAILFASLDLQFFRYPRFLVCDNIEDKGMEEARSRNFQRVAARMSQEFSVRHQIIVTTSMIDPSLDDTGVCVGPRYGKECHTLNFHRSA